MVDSLGRNGTSNSIEKQYKNIRKSKMFLCYECELKKNWELKTAWEW